jgi:biopolymer transport protein ExbD
MIRRNRRLREVPMLNTASLPDLIFTVLFFFMIVTHMRTTTSKVKYALPQGTELKRLVKKSAVTYIYIGRDMPKTTRETSTVVSPNTSSAVLPNTSSASSMDVSAYKVQLNNRVGTIGEVASFVANEKKRMNPDDQVKMTVSIKADRSTPMYVINAVKRAVRAGGATVEVSRVVFGHSNRYGDGF